MSGAFSVTRERRASVRAKAWASPERRAVSAALQAASRSLLLATLPASAAASMRAQAGSSPPGTRRALSTAWWKAVSLRPASRASAWMAA